MRILRAVKFAARCDLSIEPETYRCMMEHRQEIAKCAQARVTEEIYRLLRAGAARRSFELLIETGLLEVLLPELASAWRNESSDPQAKAHIERFWAYLRALDESILARNETPSDAMILATLLLPPLRDALSPGGASAQHIGQVVAQAAQPILERLKASRRDSDLCRQILLTARYLLPGSRPQRHQARLESRPFYQDALWLSAIVAQAEGFAPSAAGAVSETPSADAGSAEDELPPELLVELDADQGRNRRDRFGRRDRGRQPHTTTQPATQTAPNGRGARPPTPAETSRPWQPKSSIRTPIPSLDDLVLSSLDRPAFLGRGVFGGRWAARGD